MSLFIASLNSGSNGNCYYIGNEEEAVLIDAGISCRETERRMKRLGLAMDKVRAVFISHEHSDHINGLPGLAGKYRLPVYITPGTLANCHVRHSISAARTFSGHEPVRIGALSVTGFPKHHDAGDPHSFVISDGDVTIGVFTDIGAVCEEVTRYFRQCHAVFLEANYDEQLLDRGRYPYFLKQRIRGGKGHLSNAQALALFAEHRPAFMSHVLLAHLSRDNNDPELAQALFAAQARGTHVTVASRYAESPVFQIDGRAVPEPAAAAPVNVRPAAAHAQLSLFG